MQRKESRDTRACEKGQTYEIRMDERYYSLGQYFERRLLEPGAARRINLPGLPCQPSVRAQSGMASTNGRVALKETWTDLIASGIRCCLAFWTASFVPCCLVPDDVSVLRLGNSSFHLSHGYTIAYRLAQRIGRPIQAGCHS